MTTLRFGILSTGNIARQFAKDVNAGGKRSTLAAVASRSQGAADAFASNYNIPNAYGSYDALLHDPGVDAVYIALPNAMHKDWTLKALEAGKHVLCEKPLAMNHAEAVEMFDAAARAGRVLIEAFMYRCHPQTHAVLAAVRGGAIGQVKLVRTSFCYRTKKIEGNVRFDAALGGGALMDIGCYCVDFARLIFGSEPTAVRAVGRLHESGVDVAASGVLQFPGAGGGGGSASGDNTGGASGGEATFSCGMDAQASNLAQVCGTEGYIEVPVPWKPAEAGAVWSLHRMTPPKQDAPGSAPGSTRGTSPGNQPITGPTHERFTLDAGQPLYALEADAFARCVLDGEEPFITPAESLSNAKVLDALMRQVRGA